MSKEYLYNLSYSHRFASVLDQFENTHIDKGTSFSSQKKVYDTFDWRLFKNQLILFECDQVMQLYKSNKSKCISQFAKTEATPPAQQDFPPVLKNVIANRALYPRLQTRETHQEYFVKDSQQNHIARVCTIFICAQDEKKIYYKIISLTVLQESAKQLRNQLNAMPGVTKIQNIYSELLQKLKILPKTQNASAPHHFSKKTAVNIALSEILHAFLVDIQENTPGIIKDIDTECLHDFRVAIRRSRAALSQLRKVIPEYDLSDWNQKLAGIQQHSNRLRDLDVYVQDQQKYIDQIPKTLQ